MQSAVSISIKSKKFNGFNVLENINFDILDGQFISLLGKSGIGKSTIMRIINGLDTDFEGKVLIDNVPIQKYDMPFAYMPQNDSLLPWYSVIKNITLPLEVQGVSFTQAKEKAFFFLHEFGLYEFKDFYPKQLSGGINKRISLLRTFMIESSLICFDEPFGSLDSITRMNIQKWLIDICNKYNRCVLFITHDIEEALYLSDKVKILANTPATVVKSIDIEFQRDRTRDLTLTPLFIEYKKEILNILGL